MGVQLILSQVAVELTGMPRLMLREVQGMLAEGVDAGLASPLPAQQHVGGSALKGSVELAAMQPASLGTPAVPDIMQAAEIHVRFRVCT